MSQAKDRPTPAQVLVVGRNQERVNTLLTALKGDGMPCIGAITLSGMRTALQEFPSVSVVCFLYSDDVLAPFECVVMKIEPAVINNYYSLASWMGWECSEQCSESGYETNTIGVI